MMWPEPPLTEQEKLIAFVALLMIVGFVWLSWVEERLSKLKKRVEELTARLNRIG